MESAATKSAAELAREFAPLGQSSEYNEAECARMADLIGKIQRLKRERNAVILAHNYQRPEIFEVADFVGDSLELARRGTEVDADVIVLCGVHFMAESAKILSPEKKVLIPDVRAGCSLAESVTAEALIERRDELRRAFPDLQVVAYVNTTAAVKAVVDVCCTSANAVKIVEGLPTDNILFVPDEHLASYVQSCSKKNIIAWDGNCYVHHQITPDHILSVKRSIPNLKVLVHPECRQDVIDLADAVLSTSGMVRYAKESNETEFLIVTECGLSDKLLLEVPEKHFYKACKLCQYMKMITLDATLAALEQDRYEITIDEEVRRGAVRSLERMLELSK